MIAIKVISDPDPLVKSGDGVVESMSVFADIEGRKMKPERIYSTSQPGERSAGDQRTLVCDERIGHRPQLPGQVLWTRVVDARSGSASGEDSLAGIDEPLVDVGALQAIWLVGVKGSKA